MTTTEKIHAFKLKSDLWILFFGLVKGIFRCGPLFLFGVLLFSLLDFLFQMPFWARQIFWLGLAGSTAALFFTGWWPLGIFNSKSKSINLARNFQIEIGPGKLREDDFHLAVQFLNSRVSPDCSPEAARLFLEDFSNKLSSLKPTWAAGVWKWRRPFFLFLSSLALSVSLWAFFPAYFPINSRTFFPFASGQLDKFLRIIPGDGEVEWGKDMTVEVFVREKSIYKPTLFVKKEEGWVEIKEIKSGQTTVFQFQKVVKPIIYRVKWKNEWSRKFLVTPRKPISIEEFQVQVTAPDYLGAKLIRMTSSEISGLTGSKVDLIARLSESVTNGKIVFSNGNESDVSILKNNQIAAHFVISGEMNYGFNFHLGGRDISFPPEYPIRSTRDQNPTVVLLSPSEDLLISNTEKLPLTYQASDDFGVGSVQLEFAKGEGKSALKIILSPRENKESLMETYLWNLSDFPFGAGEVIKYRLVVEDKNTLSGPGRGFSEWRVIEISSFEKTHDDIESLLELWRDKALETLGEANTLEEKAQDEKTDLGDLVPNLGKLASESDNLERGLKEILKMMEKDPYADYRVWLEHKAIQENLEFINRQDMRELEGAFQTKNRPATLQKLKKMAADFERMAALSEDLSKSQKAEDMVSTGENLEEVGDDLVKGLEDLQNSTPQAKQEMANQIMEMLKKAENLLKNLANTIQKTPQDLPEDFVNQEALKKLDFGKSQDILSQINEALKKGDYDEALRLAKSFLKAAEEMSKQLSSAQSSYSEGNSAENLEKEIKSQQEKLNQIIESERNLLAETQGLEFKRLEKELEEQSKLLGELAKRQEKVVARTTALISRKDIEISHKSFLQLQLADMQVILNEMKNRKLEKGLGLLDSVTAKMNSFKDEIDKSTQTKSYFEDIRWIADEETEILKLIRSPLDPKKMTGENDKKTFGGLSQKQGDVRKDTQSLQGACQLLSRKTAQLGDFISESMGSAIKDMEKASGNLNDFDSKNAQGSEESALDHLLQGQSMLEQIQNSMALMPGGQGGGAKNNIRVIRRGGGIGPSGSNIGRVKIPTIEDYRPPKEFREELLESLKEKYPKNYEHIIQEYFKRLAQ